MIALYFYLSKVLKAGILDVTEYFCPVELAVLLEVNIQFQLYF